MTQDPTRVILIVGTGRSGSTLLGNSLGALPHVFSAGEVRFAWERGLAEDAMCGCRQPVRSCHVWRDTFELAFGSVPSVSDAASFHGRLKAATRLRTLPRYLRGEVSNEQRELAATIGRVHRAFAAVTGAKVVVDSSKLPTYAALLGLSPGLDIRMVHLVRDPRATAFSWQRLQASQVAEGFEESMDRFSIAKSTLLWTVWNGVIPSLLGAWGSPTLTIRYEDLVASPDSTLQMVLAHADIRDAEFRFATDGSLDLEPSHNIAGNPNRLRYGRTYFRHDTEWGTAMKPISRVGASLISWPIRGRFGYH